MPPVGDMMSDAQVADVTVRTHFGNTYSDAVSQPTLRRRGGALISAEAPSLKIDHRCKM